MFSQLAEVGVKCRMEPWVALEPGFHGGLAVGRVVVEDDVDLQPAGDVAVDHVQELEELGVAVAR